MKHRRQRRKFALAGIAVAIFLSALWQFAQPPSREMHIVTRIIDGDTIVVSGGERVRLLGIDTAEKGQQCSSEATERLAQLIDGKEVMLESGGEDRDLYDRQLRFIFLNETMVNLVLVHEGLANLYIVDRNMPYYSQFLDAEKFAMANGGCLWK